MLLSHTLQLPSWSGFHRGVMIWHVRQKSSCCIAPKVFSIPFRQHRVYRKADCIHEILQPSQVNLSHTSVRLCSFIFFFRLHFFISFCHGFFLVFTVSPFAFFVVNVCSAFNSYMIISLSFLIVLLFYSHTCDITLRTILSSSDTPLLCILIVLLNNCLTFSK